MSANKPAIRVARTQRMLAELGHTDIIAALRHAEEMRGALRVIKSEIDNDHRFGCLAYGVMPVWPHQGEKRGTDNCRVEAKL